MLSLEGVTIRMNSSDTRIWINESYGSFYYKSYFKLLVNDPNLQDFGHYASMWKHPSLSKVKVLKWNERNQS